MIWVTLYTSQLSLITAWYGIHVPVRCLSDIPESKFVSPIAKCEVLFFCLRIPHWLDTLLKLRMSMHFSSSYVAKLETITLEPFASCGRNSQRPWTHLSITSLQSEWQIVTIESCISWAKFNSSRGKSGVEHWISFMSLGEILLCDESWHEINSISSQRCIWCHSGEWNAGNSASSYLVECGDQCHRQ